MELEIEAPICPSQLHFAQGKPNYKLLKVLLK